MQRGLRVVEPVEQDRELVAAEAGHDVAGPQAGRQPFGERNEHAIADLVTQAVVDDLEPIDVEEQHRDVFVVTGARCCAFSSSPTNRQRFGRRVKRVVMGLERELLLGEPSLGDVAHVAHETRDRGIVEPVRDADVEPVVLAVGVQHRDLDPRDEPGPGQQVVEQRLRAFEMILVQ